MRRYQLLKKSAVLWSVVVSASKMKEQGLDVRAIVVAISKREEEIKAGMGLNDETTMLEYIAAVKGLDSGIDALESLESLSKLEYGKDRPLKARAFDYFLIALADELTT